MKYIVFILALLVLPGFSCSEQKRQNETILQMAAEIETLKKENNSLKGSIHNVKEVVKEVIPEDAKRAVTENHSLMTKFQILGMFIIGIGVLATIVLWSIIPPFKYIGFAVTACGGAWYYLAITNQILIPFLPYVILAVLAFCFVGGVIYAIKHIDWTPDEKEGIKDIANGRYNTPMATKLFAQLKLEPSQFQKPEN